MNVFKKFGAGIAKVAIGIFVPKKYRELSTAVVDTIAVVDKVDEMTSAYVCVASDVNTGKIIADKKEILIAKATEKLTTTTGKLAETLTTTIYPTPEYVETTMKETLIANMVALIGCYEMLLHLERVKATEAQKEVVKSQIKGLKRDLASYLLGILFDFSKGVLIKYIENYFIKKNK